jgi:hypothetical protein
VVARGKRDNHPRDLLSDESADILRICGEAPDRVAAEWRFQRRKSISVARRDGFVGAKR